MLIATYHLIQLLFCLVPVKVEEQGPGLDQRRTLKWAYTPPHIFLPLPGYKGIPGSGYNLNLSIGKHLND
jgi:hypothetical protein